LFSYNTIK